MWTLECEGDVFAGKKLWLKPGKKYVLGRNKQDDGQKGMFVITDKTISRQHLQIEITSVENADCANAQSRSRVTLTDLKTKIGSLLNGEQLRAQSRVLEQKENLVSIGRYPHHFRFTWVPVALYFPFTNKELRAEPYPPLYEQLGPLDIKVLSEYEREFTTHVVVKKRNTSKGLLALVDGKFIVDSNTFVNAITAIATSSEPSELENDFSKFPNALDYLPPKGNEPTERVDAAYAPDTKRQDMFEGYTFIFYDKSQFENLLAPITGGCGKVLYREVVPGTTNVQDFLRYVKDVAGEKGQGEFEDSSEGKGVVVVKHIPAKGSTVGWYAQFSIDIALSLDHRLIEQNEFLDAILGINPSALRKALEPEPLRDVTSRDTPATNISFQAPPETSQIAPASLETQPSQPSRRTVRSRRVPVPKFTGFDDDDFGETVNSDIIPEYASTTVDSAPAQAPVPVYEPQSQGLFVSQSDPDINMEREVPPPLAVQPRTSRKRRATPIDDDALMPNAIALKKRRLEDAKARRDRGESTPAPEPVPPPAPEPPKPKAPSPKPKRRARKEIDVQEEIRENMEQIEKAAIAEQEALESIMDPNVAALRDLALIEEMPVGRSRPALREAGRADESERWDNKWNGRRNFKQFRRRGVGPANNRAYESVIVQLEEVKKRDFGIGDVHWLDDIREGDNESLRPDNRKKKGKEREQIQNEGVTSQFRPSRITERPSPVPVVVSSDAEPEPETTNTVKDADDLPGLSPDDEEDEEPPRPASKKASKSQSESLVDKASTAKSLPTQSSPGSSSRKRAAPTPMTKPAPAKKARQTTLGATRSLVKRGRKVSEEQEDESSDDGLKFKFRKRG